MMPNYVIARNGQEPVDFMGIRDHLGFRPVILFRQFAPHGIQAEFAWPRFAALGLMASLSRRIPSLTWKLEI